LSQQSPRLRFKPYLRFSKLILASPAARYRCKSLNHSCDSCSARFLLFFPLKGRLTRLTPSSFSFVFIFLVTEAAIRCYSVWNGTEPFFVLLYCGNEQVIVRWVAFVKFISSDESILRFVYSYFVTEFRGLGEFPFLIRPRFGVKETDDPIRNDPVAGHDLLGLLDQFSRQQDGFAELFFCSLDGSFSVI
jgi:hypothetical protein